MDFNLEAVAGEDDGLLMVAPQPPLHHVRLQLGRWSYIHHSDQPHVFSEYEDVWGRWNSPSCENCCVSYVSCMSYFQLH